MDQSTDTTDLGVNIKQEYIESIALSKQPRKKRCKYLSISKFQANISNLLI